MKLMFVSTSGVGHVLPMLGLALAARHRGHAVAWATAADAWPLLHANGITTLAAGVPFAQCRAETRARWPQAPSAGRAQAAHAFPHQFGTVIFEHMLQDLGAAIDAFEPDLVVNETGALAAPLVARQHGVAHITHAFGLPIPSDILHAATRAVAPAWHAAGLHVPPCAGLYEQGAIEIAPPSLQAAHGHKPQALRVWQQQAASVAGSVASRQINGLSESLVNFLQADRTQPLVYCTFGTLFDHGPAFARMLQALAAVAVRFVVTSVSQSAATLLWPLAPNVYLCGYVPQHLLLPHCQAVLSHAGSGTMFGALAHGLPQLCLPQGADQFRNADALVTCGAALMLEGDHTTDSHIAAAVQRLLQEPDLRLRAQALAQESAAMPTPDEVVTALESFEPSSA
jgi:UDP:flavonoid glycosyltransferase YjiC (YdhE family)